MGYWTELAARVCPALGDGERASTPLLLPGRNPAGILFVGRGSEGNPREGRSAADAVVMPLLKESGTYGLRDLDTESDEKNMAGNHGENDALLGAGLCTGGCGGGQVRILEGAVRLGHVSGVSGRTGGGCARKSWEGTRALAQGR